MDDETNLGRLVFEGQHRHLEELTRLEEVGRFLVEHGINAYFDPSTGDIPPNYDPRMVTWKTVYEGEQPVAIVTEVNVDNYCEENGLNPTPVNKLFRVLKARINTYANLRQFVLFDKEGLKGLRASELEGLIVAIKRKHIGLQNIGPSTSDFLEGYFERMIVEDAEPE